MTGIPTWFELGVDDPRRAQTFYGGLFGWEAAEDPRPEAGGYTMFTLRGKMVAAASPPQEEGIPPHWTTYIASDDVDATAAKIRDAGGTVLMDPFDVFDAGRMAVLQDPTGAHFAVWQPGTSIGATLVNVPGALCLNQLNTSDPERAAAFYADILGWRIEQVGTEPAPYWGIWNGEGLNGGMMALPPDAPASHWLLYFATDDIDATAARAGELGGRVLVPPVAVPGGRIAVAMDPTGAMFGLLTGRMDP